MSRYVSFDPNVEMTGRTALSFVKSILHDDIAEILERHQLSNIDPDGWYRVQTLLDVLTEISEGLNTSSIFVSLGVAAAQLGIDGFPPALKNLSLPEFFLKYGDVWVSRHRNGDCGSVTCEVVDDKHLIMHVRTPFPDDIFYGAIYGYARFFCPQDKTFTVSYDQTQPGHDHGGEETVLHIRLQP